MPNRPAERPTLSDALSDDQAERDGAQPASDDYTGEPCEVCGRIRVYVRRDGQRQCEKCETVFPRPAERPPTDTPQRVAVPAWIFAETDRCNRFLLSITPEGRADVDGGHDDPAEVAKAKHLIQRIGLIRKPEGTRWVMLTIEEVPAFTGRVNASAIATLNGL